MKRKILKATCESLEGWQGRKLIYPRGDGFAKWSSEYCALCDLSEKELDSDCMHNQCPLVLTGNRCGYGIWSPYGMAMYATKESDKQPLIEALELATVYAALDRFAEMCAGTINKIKGE